MCIVVVCCLLVSCLDLLVVCRVCCLLFVMLFLSRSCSSLCFSIWGVCCYAICARCCVFVVACRLLCGVLSIVSWRMSFVGCWMWLVVCLLCVVCWSLLLFGCMLLVDCRSVRVVCVVL